MAVKVVVSVKRLVLKQICSSGHCGMHTILVQCHHTYTVYVTTASKFC